MKPIADFFFGMNASIKGATAVLSSSFIFMKAINCGKGIELRIAVGAF
jgi:hypothetical protein